MGTVVQMYSSSAPANNLASIDVPRDGTLLGIDWAMDIDSPAGDVTVTAQVSFGTTHQAVNDSRSVLSNCAISADLNTSGFSQVQANKYVSLPEVVVGAGERIYLHAIGDAVTIRILACLHFDFELDRALARRR